MAVIISNGNTNLSTTNGFYRVEDHNLAASGGTLDLGTPRTKSLTFANAGNCLGTVLTIYPNQATINYDVKAALQQNIGTATMTIASPCVVTLTAHGLANDTPIVFNTTGALPTGLTAGTTYYVRGATANTFNVSATPGGANINTTGTQSGTHTLWADRASKQLTPLQILNATNKMTNAVQVPFVFDSGYAVDTTASKWRLNVYRVSGGSSGTWSLRTSDGTNIFHATWCDNAVTFSSGNDCVICKDKVTVDMDATFKGVLGTGDSANSTCGVICRSLTPTPDNVANLVWAASPAASYTFTMDGFLMIGAHAAFRVGTSAARIPANRMANIVVKRAPTLGTAGRSGFSNPLYLGYSSSSSRKASLFLYGEYTDGDYKDTLLVNAPTTGAVTITVASPAVCTKNGHNMQDGSPFNITTTGALPTGITAGTVYYAKNCTTNTFELSAAPGGASINTSGTQSGTHTLNSNNIRTTNSTGWSVGESVFVGNRTAKGTGDTIVDRTITAISGDVITLSSNLTSGAYNGGIVLRVAPRGIKLSQDTTTTSISQYLESMSSCIVSGVLVKNFQLADGAGGATALDDGGNYIKKSIDNCIFWNAGATAKINPHANELGCDIHDLAMIGGSGVILYEGNSATSGKTGLYDFWNIFSTNTSVVSASNTVTRFKFHDSILDCGGSAITLNLNNMVNPWLYNVDFTNGSGTEPSYCALNVGTTIFSDSQKRIYNNTFNNQVTAVLIGLTAQNKCVLQDNIFGNLQPNTNDIGLTQGAYVDTTIVSPTGALTVSEVYQGDMVDGGVLQILDYNDTPGDYRSWMTYGKFVSNSGKIDQIPATTDTDLVNSYNINTGAISGSKIRLSVNAQINNAAYYAGTCQLPKLTVLHDGSTTETDTGTATTSSQELVCSFAATTDNNYVVASMTTRSDAATAANRTVTFDTLKIVMRKYGKVPSTIIKTITRQTKELLADLVPLLTDSLITQTIEATVAAYTGATINHASSLATLDGTGITPVNSSAMLYDYTQYDLSLTANMDKDLWFYSVDGGLSFNSSYDLTFNGVSISSSAILRMGVKTLTLTSGGMWGGVIDGNVTITSAGTYPLNIGTKTITFTAAGAYDLSGGDITGNVTLVNTSGGSVTVTLAAGVSYTNTGPNITVDIPPVAITVGNLVSGSRLYIYDTVLGGGTVLYNDIPAGASQAVNITVTGNLTKVKVRKAGYKTWETTVSPGASGASITAGQEADPTYNASYNAGMATDWSINTGTKKLTRNTTNWNTVRDFHSYWNYLFATSSYMQYDVPTSAATKYDVSFINGYGFVAADSFQKLKSGSITDTATDDLWASLITIGDATTETVYVSQSGTKITSYWSTGNIDILVKVKASGVLIDSGNLEVYCHDFNSIYDHQSVTIIESGKNYVPISTGTDPNNTTLAATVATYNDITITETPTSQDIGDGTGAHSYLGTIDCAGRTKEQVFEYLKYITRRTSTFTIDGVDGELFIKLDAAYTEVKNGPLAEMSGGILFAQGWWITNIASADTLNYVVIDTTGGSHAQPTPPVTLNVTNIFAGSRIQLYDLTTSTELANEIVAGTSFSINYTYPGTDHDIEIRLMYQNGTTAKEYYETQGTATVSGMNIRASQVDDAVYIANNIDGSTITTVVINDGTLRVNVNTGSITWAELYAYETYWLFTAEGIRDRGRFAQAPDTANYIWTDFKIKNVTSPSVALVITGGYGKDAASGTSLGMIDTTGGTIIMAPDHVVPYAAGAEATVATVQAGLTAQGYTTARAPKIDDITLALTEDNFLALK